MRSLLKEVTKRIGGGLSLAAALALLASSSGCSPSAFFGDGKDKVTENLPSYRKVNLACSGIRLESSTLDNKTFKSLIDCFNSDGALPELAGLVDVMSERDLTALVQAINRHLLSNPRALHGLERAFLDLDERKLLDPLLLRTSKLLGNEKLVSATLGLLKDKSILDSISGYLGVRYEISDKNVLRALEMIGERVDAEGAINALDEALLIARSREFPVLQAKLLVPSPAGRKLEDLVSNVLQYATEEKMLPVGKRFAESLLAGDLQRSLDDLVGNDHGKVRVNVPKLGAVMKTMLAGDGKKLRDLGLLFNVLADPISCLKGARAIPNVSRNFLAELVSRTPERAAEHILQGSVVTHAAISPFCDLKPELDLYYPAVAGLARDPNFRAVHELLKSLAAVPGPQTGSQPLLDLFVDFLADPGAGSGGGFQLLLPLLTELNDREAWDDIALVATLSRKEARTTILPDTVKFLTEPAAKLGDKSVADVLGSAVSRASVPRITELAGVIEELMRKPEPLLAPALASLREAYYVNDSHPYIELVSELLSRATENEELLNSLLTLSSSKEFGAFIRSIERMAKSGQLKDLMGATLTLFHDFGERAAYPIAKTTKPPLLTKLRHDFTSAELTPYVGQAIQPKASDECGKVRLTFPLADSKAPGFDEQLDHLTACIDSGGARPDAAQAILFARQAKVDDGRSFLAFNIDLMKGLPFEAKHLGFLVDAWSGAMDDGRFFRMLDAGALWAPTMKPLVELVSPLMAANRPELARLESLGGKLLRRDDLPRVVRYVDDLANAQLAPEAPYNPPPHLEVERDRLQKWILNKECDIPQSVEERAQAVLSDYRDAINNWEVINGKGRRRWSLSEFYPRMEDVLAKMGQPASIPEEEHPTPGQKYVVDALMNVLKYFTLKPGQKKDRFRHYEPQELTEWFWRRSNDYRPITYFFPSEDKPRVRLVNTLDMLELVLVNADYVAPWPFDKNFALEFSALIAQAWGDEPMEVWPAEILREYQSTGKWPLKLAEAVTKMWDSQLQFELIMGYPDIPKCTRRDASDPDDHELPTYGISVPTWMPLPGEVSALELKKSLYNLRQLLRVLEENNPTNDHDVGLRVLRDLFFQTYYSTPPQDRDPKKGWANNLSLVLRLTRLGFTRETSRQLRLYPTRSAALDDFFRGLIEGAMAPETRSVMRSIVVDDSKHELIWKAMREIFDVINASEGLELSPERKAELKGKSAAEIQAIHARWVQEEKNMKQLGFFAIAALPELQVTDPALKSVAAVLSKYRPFLVANADQLENVLKSGRLANFFRALYESPEKASKQELASVLREALADPQAALDGMAIVKTLADDPKLKQRFDDFRAGVDQLLASSEYGALNMGEIARQLADFLEERSGDPVAIDTARRLRGYLADRLQAGDADQLLNVMAKHPDEFKRLLDALGISSSNGDFRDFFGYLRRNLN